MGKEVRADRARGTSVRSASYRWPGSGGTFRPCPPAVPRTSSARSRSAPPSRSARSRRDRPGPSTSSTRPTRRWRPRCRSWSAPSTCCSATSRTPSRPTTRWPRAKDWSTIAQSTAGLGGGSGPTQLWTRINALDSPWVLDDLTTLVPAIGDKLDVVMVPKVQGAEDIAYVDRLLAQLEAKAGLDRPILVHAILETARGVANVEEICGASPRMQGLSLGPADLAADRRMKTTRVGGGHPGYLVREDPTADQRRSREQRPRDVPAGPLALHDRAHGRRLRDARHLAVLRAVRRHR